MDDKQGVNLSELLGTQKEDKSQGEIEALIKVGNEISSMIEVVDKKLSPRRFRRKVKLTFAQEAIASGLVERFRKAKEHAGKKNEAFSEEAERKVSEVSDLVKMCMKVSGIDMSDPVIALALGAIFDQMNTARNSGGAFAVEMMLVGGMTAASESLEAYLNGRKKTKK